MSVNRVRVFEGPSVPLIFEQSLVPNGADPDGLGPLTDVDRRHRIEYEMVCKRKPGWRRQLKRLAQEVFEHQKYQLKNSHVIADESGEPADYMNIEDICPWLAKLGVLKPYNPTYVYQENELDCRYEFSEWVFKACEDEGSYLELIAAVRAWNDDGAAFELTPYPGDRAIDGDGNYPIFLPEPQDQWMKDLALDLEAEMGEFLSEGPKRSQSKSFTDYQWPKGHSGNKRGRPRRLRETEDTDERRPHFFDTLMPEGSDGRSITYGESIYHLSRSRAVDEGDWAWIAKTDRWGDQLNRIRMSRKSFRNGGFVYKDTLDVTRIDIAIRHLGLVDVQWRKSPAARWVIKPWVVSAGLERMKKGSLTREEMEGIYLRTQTPQHVDWPNWWPEDLRCKQSKNAKLTRPRRMISGTITKP
jgi:hypothetical protein